MCLTWRKVWIFTKRPWIWPRSGRRALRTAPSTWLRDRETPYNLGELEYHLAFVTDEYEAFHARHQELGCICFENPEMGIYFIHDPDGYWIEIVPAQ